MRRSLTFAPTFAAFLAAFVLASCDDAGNIADTDGGPFSNIHTDGGGTAGSGPKDAGAGGSAGAGPTDAKVDSPAGTGGGGGARDAGSDAPVDAAKGSGGASAATGAGGTKGGGGVGGAAVPAQTCMECEAANCMKGRTKLAYTGCFNPVDDQNNPAKATGGPAQGTLKSVLCQAVLDCVRANMCEVQCDQNGLLGKDWSGKPLVSMIKDSEGQYLTGLPACVGPMPTVNPTVALEPGDIFPGCYCGFSTDPDVCDTVGMQNGPCKAAFENAAEVSSPASAPAEVGEQFESPSSALGAAVGLLQYCDWDVCRGPCLNLPPLPVASGAGGAGGSGSVTDGSGGAPSQAGSGGVNGSAGATGSAGTGGGSNLTYYQCTACEQMQSGGCKVQLRNCSTATGTAAAGPAQGMNKSNLCMAAVACVRQTGCAEPDGDVSKCYCGPDRANQENGDCYIKGLGTGACRAQFEAAAETTDSMEMQNRMINADPSMPEPYVLGFASTLIACDIAKCNDTCAAGDPPGYTPGSGGGTGSGGTSGTASGGANGTASGGTTGSGGVAGSSGVIASGGVTGSGGVIASGGVMGGGGVVGAGGVVGGGGNSLVVNPDFATSDVSWSPDFSMLATWTGAKDDNSNAASGSLLVTNVVVADVDGITIGGAHQCVPVQAAIALTLSTQVFIPSGQGSSSMAGLELDFYPTGNCTGSVSGQYTSALIADTDTWKTIQGGLATPANAQTMAVRLVISKQFRSMAFGAYFDNVLVKGP